MERTAQAPPLIRHESNEGTGRRIEQEMHDVTKYVVE